MGNLRRALEILRPGSLESVETIYVPHFGMLTVRELRNNSEAKQVLYKVYPHLKEQFDTLLATKTVRINSKFKIVVAAQGE